MKKVLLLIPILFFACTEKKIPDKLEAQWCEQKPCQMDSQCSVGQECLMLPGCSETVCASFEESCKNACPSQTCSRMKSLPPQMQCD